LAVLAERDKLGPIVLADVGDNPGGGGRGNTMWILESLVSAGAANACLGVIFDPAVVADALAAGEGAAMIADFNRQSPSELSTRYRQPATVERLTDGKFIDHHGMGRGAEIDLGPSCLLRIGGVRVAVSSKRHQIYSTDFFAHFGIDIRSVSAFAVKSRGHFRAGFEHIVSPERIYEIDAPGLTSPNLQAIPWKHLPRPILPLDPDTVWEPRPVI
jgi:microcystin degradation protein MlrC